MNEEEAFLAAILAHPDEDTPRLAFADWLDEHDRAGEAEFIRVQIELEPIRENYGEPRTDELLSREEKLLSPLIEREQAWLADLINFRGDGPRVEFRRGFPDALRLPARWLIEHAAAFRKRYPLLRKLTVHRLNGWGRELATCPHLESIRELDLPCWYGNDDAESLASSPYLADLEVLHYWRGDWRGNQGGQLRTLAASTVWPKLRLLRVVLGYNEDRDLVNATAGRSVAEVYDPSDLELFPMAADFSPYCFVGKLPDGTQFFACDPGANLYDPWAVSAEPVAMVAQLFDTAGNPTTTITVAFPPELVYRQPDETADDYELHSRREDERRTRRERFLREAIGFRPAFIRVKYFRVEGEWGPFRDFDNDSLGARDAPAADLATDYHGPFGYGGWVYGEVVNEEYKFNFGNIGVCDKRGRVVFT